MSLEVEIKKLTAAIQELSGLMGSTELEAMSDELPVHVSNAKAARNEPEPVVVEEVKPEPVKEVPVVIPTVAELQKSLGVVAQKYAPIYPVTAIKSLGGAKLSELNDDDRVKLAVLMDAVATKLGSMSADEVNATTPDAIIEACQ